MKQFMNFYIVLAIALSAGLFGSSRGFAQLSVGLGGLSVQTFDTPPPASQWSTRSTSGAAGDITSLAQLDAQVQTNSAGLVSQSLGSVSGTPPASGLYGMFASSSLNLVTRATGNRFTLLMASLRNDSGAARDALTVSYDFGIAAPVTEQVPGHAVYFSLTGTPGSWQYVPDLSGTNGGPQKSAVLPLGTWPTSALLYLLWADDNGSITPDTAYSIDNFSVAPLANAPVVTGQPVSLSVSPGGGAGFSVSLIGVTPFHFQWRKDGVEIPGATNQSLTLINVQPGDAGDYSLLITNVFGSTVSSNAALAVGCFTGVAITAQPQDKNLSAGSTLNLTVNATGTQPLGYQWLYNGAPLPGATNAAYVRPDIQNADSGYYAVVVSNCAGVVTSGRAAVSVPAPPLVLIGLTNHFWKYDQSGNDLGTAWRAPSFDDGLWASGRGIFAREDFAPIVSLTNTPLLLNPSGQGQITTYYFRTHFNFTDELTGVQLVSSNYFDDGAVVYLNGTEAFRHNMPETAISSGTLASSALADGLFVVSNLPPTLLVPGDNVLAVEVHQVNLTSSDVGFGMQLMLVPLPPTPLQFTNHPASAAVLEGHGVTFSGAVSGPVAYFQWLKNGVPVPGATASMLTLSSLAPADAGIYALRASNIFGLVFSSPATLTVLLDQNAPVLLTADLLTPTLVRLAFSEPLLLLTATNKLNYKVTNTFGAQSVVQSVTLTNQTNVLLTVSALAAGMNYIATALNIADTAPAQNALPATAAPVARTLPLVASDAVWDYFDPVPPFDEADPGPGWRDPGYDLSFWGQGVGAFRFSIDESLVPPVIVGTALGQTPTHSAFFRQPFSSLGVSPAELRLTLRHAANDGAVFYLNGLELFRDNMPEGMITPSTPAATSRANTAVLTAREIAPAWLRHGANLLAVELHQTMTVDAQKYFAAEILARAESLLVGPLLVLGGPSDTAVIESQTATFRVSSVAASGFQWQVNGGNVFGATNATFTFPASIFFDGAQIRCAVSQPGTTNFTTNATLHVLPDTTRPVLLGAHANQGGTITLSFSEPLAAASAENLSNYAVTNASGPSATIASAVLVNGTNVVLSFATSLAGRYIVVVSGVTDLANTPNTVLPGSAALVGASYFLPMISAWKYLLINTNETVQAAYMQVNYDDSAWAGPSNALLYVEDAALPAPKNTLLSLFDAGGVNRINTFYFRQKFVAPVLTSNVTARIRYLIDDGLVLHLNGQEIHRFNMPAGTITAASQATASAAEGVIVGPVEVILTNLVGGTNVLAAEVHQVGVASVDVVMGVEFSIELAGAVLTPPASVPGAHLGLVTSGAQFALVWSDPEFLLESAPAVNGPWTPLLTPSPVLISPTNAAAFHRLRR